VGIKATKQPVYLLSLAKATMLGSPREKSLLCWRSKRRTRMKRNN